MTPKQELDRKYFLSQGATAVDFARVTEDEVGNQTSYWLKVEYPDRVEKWKFRAVWELKEGEWRMVPGEAGYTRR